MINFEAEIPFAAEEIGLIPDKGRAKASAELSSANENCAVEEFAFAAVKLGKIAEFLAVRAREDFLGKKTAGEAVIVRDGASVFEAWTGKDVFHPAPRAILAVTVAKPAEE